MATVDQMIWALQAFKAKHGGNLQVVRCDPFGDQGFVSLGFGRWPVMVVELIDDDRPGYFEMDYEGDPRPVPVFVMD